MDSLAAMVAQQLSWIASVLSLRDVSDRQCDWKASGGWEVLQSELPGVSGSVLRPEAPSFKPGISVDRGTILCYRAAPGQDHGPSELEHLSTRGFLPTAAGGHFRSLPTSAWDSIYDNFAPTGREVTEFSLEFCPDLEHFSFSDNELLKILCSFAEAIKHALKHEHGVDFSREAKALQDNWTKSQKASANAAALTRPELSGSQVLAQISAVREMLNENMAALNYCVVIPEFNVDLRVLRRTLASTIVAKRWDATPAWTGLKVRKKEASLASKRVASVNRHGGASSAISRGSEVLRRVSEALY
jgi:hypothetical protein